MISNVASPKDNSTRSLSQEINRPAGEYKNVFSSVSNELVRALSYESSQSNFSESDFEEDYLADVEDKAKPLPPEDEEKEQNGALGGQIHSKIFLDFGTESNKVEMGSYYTELTDDEDLSQSDDPFEDLSELVEMYKEGKDIKDYEKEHEMDEIDRMFSRSTQLGARGGILSLHSKSRNVNIWKGSDYTAIFNRLGDAMSSGIIDIKSMAIILPKVGFYTLFIHNAKSLYDKNIDLSALKATFKYSCVNDVKRSEIDTADVTGFGHFKIKMCGNISIKPNFTYLILLYAITEDQIVDLEVRPSNFDYKPDIMYKLYYSGPYYRIPLPLKFKRRLRILSLDNTDNFGTAIISVLYLLEQKLEEVRGCKVNLTDYFDFICGTGTGAIVALCLLKGYTMKELKTQWHIIISSLFKITYTLPSGILFDYCCIEEFKKSWIDILGTDMMTNKTTPLCMVTSTNVKCNPYEIFLFRNYNVSSLKDMVNGTCHAPMWLAGWSATALPTCVRGPNNTQLGDLGYSLITKTHLIDGSLISSTPSLLALQELCSLYNVSLQSLIYDNIDLLLSIDMVKNKGTKTAPNYISTWKILLNCKSLMFNTQLQHEHAKKLFEERKGMYHRIHVPAYQGYKYNKDEVDFVLESTMNYIKNKKSQQLDDIVNIIKQ